MFDRLYHVPRSQVWQGSRGAQTGHVHLHVREQFDHGRIHRSKGRALCGRDGWWERPLDPGEVEPDCPRCAEIAARL
jgi:hypothetical protein